MTSQEPRTRATEIIRIVPLRVAPEPVPDQVAPRLTYRGGPLLTSVRVVTVFWGSAWTSEQALVDEINTFYDTILRSAYLDALTEYSVRGQTIGRGTRAGSAIITASDPGATVADSEIQSFLQDNLGSALPEPSTSSLYMVYLPPEIKVTMGGNESCTAFCGYHDSIDKTLFYGVLPYPSCSGCLGGMPPLEALTVTSSHELAEAITDPVPGTGWYDDANGEIGDICAWQTETVGGYTVQKEWSNAKSACV